MSRVTISMKAARALEAWRKWFGARLDRITDARAGEDYSGYEMDLFDATAPAPKRKPRKPPRKPPRSAFDHAVNDRLTRPSKAQKRAETADLWKQAMVRSGGFCECGCGRAFHEEGDNKPEMDHEASRRVPQTITNVWMLARVCHHQRQANKPSEEYWLRVFLVHCRRHEYWNEARRVEDRIAVVGVKTTLPAAPKVTP